MDNENPTPCFPDEIIVEILSRLPVKSLLKFRSVSKSWLSLLSNPYFIKTQVNLDVKNVNHRLAVVASVPGLGKVCSVYSLLSEKSSCKIPKVGSAVSEKDPRLVKTVLNVTNLDYPFKPPLGSARLVGSCNGLICLTTVSYNLMLWNPSTGKYKEFPESFVQGGVGCFIRYGFGYDASNDDYKVVKILSFPKNEGKHENVVNVYSSKANSWRMIQGFDSGYINGLLGVFVNGTGTLHWDVCNLSGSWEIMTFDLVTERFGKMGFPSCGNGEFSWMLSVSGGRLVGCYNYYPYRTDVWVMKEYSVQDSWTKLVSLSCPVDRRGYISPLFVSENGDEVLVKLGTEISVYNSRNGTYESVKVLSSGGRVHVQAVAYIESLASPDVISN